jgi:putative transposase
MGQAAQRPDCRRQGPETCASTRPDADSSRILDALAEKLPQVAAHLDAARADVVDSSFPKAIWRRIWSNIPQKRLNQTPPPRT